MSLACYVHVPFCHRICTYCDFYRVVHDANLELAYAEALCREIELRPIATRAEPVILDTLYFGGGTPTTLSADSWRRMFARLRSRFRFSDDAEITVEANPESATPDKLELLRELGVNRLSLGVQSFSSANLTRLGRLHDSDAATQAFARARAAGFGNVSLDLMYGLADETAETLDHDLRTAVELAPEHLSFYALTLEGEAPLRFAVLHGEIALPEDDLVSERFAAAVALLESNGYQHYEISNFSRPGFECRHNLAYWQLQEYLAFGPAAVATIGDLRIKNEPDLRAYTSALAAGELPPADREELLAGKRLIETIMMSLRLGSGLDCARLKEQFGYDLLAKREELLKRLQLHGDILLTGKQIRLTTQGMFRSDLIASALLPDWV